MQQNASWATRFICFFGFFQNSSSFPQALLNILLKEKPQGKSSGAELTAEDHLLNATPIIALWIRVL